MKQQKKAYILYSALIGLVCMLGMYVPVLLFVAPGFLAFTGLAWGTPAFVAAALFSAAGAFFAMDLGSALLIVSIFLPAAFALFILAKKRAPWRNTTFYVSSLLCAGFYSYMCLPSLFAGDAPFAMVSEAAAQKSAELLESFRTAGAEPEIIKELTQNLKQLETVIPKAMLSLILAAGLIFGLLSVVIAKSLAKKAGASLAPMEKFEMWQLPKDFLWGSIFLFAIAVIGMLLDYSEFDAVFLAVQAVIAVPLAIQGLSFEYYLLGRRKNPSLARSILILAIIVLFPFSVAALVLMGVLEQIFKLRIRLKGFFNQ